MTVLAQKLLRYNQVVHLICISQSETQKGELRTELNELHNYIEDLLM